MNIPKLIEKASSSKFQLWKLNQILWAGIPFNKPHKFKIVEIKKGEARIKIPFIRKNFNHLKTLHACSMATCAEYSSGLVLGTHFNFKEYRLIMKEIKMNYHYQGKMDAYCEFRFTDSDFKNAVEELQKVDKLDLHVEVKCIDLEKNHLATGYIIWQLKDWKKTSRGK